MLTAATLRRCFACLFVLSLHCAGGCQTPFQLGSANRPPLAQHTYIVHVAGIGGRTSLDVNWVKALGKAGVADHLEAYDWTTPFTWIGALHAYAHNRAEARMIAGHIAAKLKEDPQARIILTAWSGGCQIIVWALEDLPPEAKVQSVVMIAPAIRPNYDLSRALAHVRGSMFACTSPGDWFILGWGTRVFGASDGTHTNAAGMVGFSMPPGADIAVYKKLVQLRYAAAWLRYGNLGGHNGGISAGFAREILAPKLKADAQVVEKTSQDR